MNRAACLRMLSLLALSGFVASIELQFQYPVPGYSNYLVNNGPYTGNAYSAVSQFQSPPAQQAQPYQYMNAGYASTVSTQNPFLPQPVTQAPARSTDNYPAAALLMEGNQPFKLPPMMPLTAGTPSVFPGCADILSFGSPILLAYQAERLLEDAMKVQAQGTFVRYVYYKKENGPQPFSLYHKLIFELQTPLQAYYVGIWLDNPTSGIASAKFLKFILNPNLNVVTKILKITEALPSNAYTCGDLKMIFSSFGNDPRERLPGVTVGFNRNAIPPALYKALKELMEEQVPDKSPPTPAVVRECKDARYVRSSKYYSADASVFSSGTYPPNMAGFSEIGCDPSGEALLTQLNLYCLVYPPAFSISGQVWGIQGTFRTAQSNGFRNTPVYGVTPGPTGTGVPLTHNINLSSAAKMEIHYTSGASLFFGINLLDGNNNNIASYYCGNPGICPSTCPNGATQERQTYMVRDILGFWGARLNPQNYSAAPLSFLGFWTYV